MTRTKLLSAALFAAAMLAAPAMARESHVTSRHLAEDANAGASAHFLQRPRTEKIATSVITRMYVEVGSALSAEMRLGQPCMSGDRRREANNHAAFRK